MAKVVGGFGSSHGPLMSLLTGEFWESQASNDTSSNELVKMPEGERMTFDELLACANPTIATVVNHEVFQQRIHNLQASLDELRRRFIDANPDIVVMIGDDQDEFFFDDNMPMINIYWGESIRMVPRVPREGASEAQVASARAYGEDDRDYPVAKDFGLHLIESLANQDFDIAHSQYMKEAYGGSIGPATWYLDTKRTTKPRRFGLPHAFAFPITRWFGGLEPPIVPITINTCYPPNWISSRRAYDLGVAVRRAVDDWDTDKTVAFVTSGGLSHFVVDEEFDRLVLGCLETANSEMLRTLPRVRLQSATTEILNWVCVAGAMKGICMSTIAYEAGYRTSAGTGCGCAVGHWAT